MEPEILDFIPKNTRYSYEKELFPSLLDMHKPVFGYETGEYWIDIGTPASYFKLHQDILDGRSRRYTGKRKDRLYIDPTVKLGKDFSHKGTVVVGSDCITGSGTSLQDSILWSEISIGANTLINNTIIADQCRIGDECRIEGAVIGSNVTIASGVHLSAGSLVYPGSRIQ